MTRSAPALPLLALLLAGTSACTATDDADDDGVTPDDLPADTSEPIVTRDCPGLPAAVEEVRLDGDALVVTAGFGGCRETRIWACWDGTFLESYPVQVPLQIHHEPAGECDAWLTPTQAISLATVIDRHERAYGPGPFDVRVDDARLRWEP